MGRYQKSCVTHYLTELIVFLSRRILVENEPYSYSW